MISLKRNIILLLLLLLNFTSFGQTYGNEWINYSQPYYRFQIYETGIYMIDYNALVSAGVPVSTFQTENIQLYGRQKEIPIHVEDGGDSSFDSGDYILFYAEKNDGWLDSTLYIDPNTLANPAYSLYNDTINYFFTWNSSTSNLRYTVETDVSFSSYSSIANYILFKSEYNYNNVYLEGEKKNKITSSFFTQGEGWGRTEYNGGNNGGHTSTFSMSTPYVYTSGPNATFHGLSTSASSADATNPTINHHTRWEIGTTNTPLLDTTYFGYTQIRCSTQFSPSLLSTNTPLYYKIIDDLGALTDYQSVTYHSVVYPRQPNFGGSNELTFQVVNDPQGKVRLDATNVSFSNPIMLVHGDIPRMIPFALNGGVYSALIPNSSDGSNQTVVYQDASLVQSVNQLIPVSSTGYFTDYTTFSPSLDSVLLFVYHSKLNPPSNPVVDQYMTYRQTTGYNVLMADVDELYLQFGGGIEKHINGIRRFAHYIYNNATVKPSGLFLIGKGIREASINETGWDGPGARKDTSRFRMSLVPSFGLPSSDVSITSNLLGFTSWTPLMPTGRISAQSAQELSDYLSKVIEYETQQDQFAVYDTPNKDWQKHIMHFAGGSDITQQTIFQGYLNGYKNIIEDSLFGGAVHNVFKTSSNPLDPTILAGITDRIEQGVSLMTYFGHATATNSGFEINLDDPQNWNNTGKYPLMLVNSCYNGNIFQENLSKSEEFVQVADYGAIGYIASAGLGLDSYLNIYSNRLYLEMGRLNYSGSIGMHMLNTIGYMFAPGVLYREATAQQMVLNGDPMLRLNWHKHPEIELLPQNVSFSPSNLDLSVDSIEMTILIKNLGRSIPDSSYVTVEVTRDFPGSTTDSIYIFQIPGLHYTHELTFKMPMQANIGVGLNNFTIKADLPNVYTEQYDEINNNQIVKTLFINIDGILPVIPYEFAVVPNDSVTVKGSTINPIADYNTYRFELDTTDAFNSPEFRYAIVSGYGGVKEVNPSDWLNSSGQPFPLQCTDSTVYFWRCAVDTIVPDWRESSFQYIINKEGWGQDHFFQFKNNSFTGVNYNKPARLREFGPYTREISCDVRWSTAGLEPYYNAFYIDGDLEEYGVCNFTPKLHVAVFDPVSLNPWETYCPAGGCVDPFFSLGNNNDNCTCQPTRCMKFFTFNQNDSTRLENFRDMVLNTVPDSFYILVYSPMTTRYDWWDQLDSVNMYNTFATLGSDSIVPGRMNTPFAFFCKKGDTNSVVELFAPTATDDVYLSVNIQGADYEGTEAAPLIGPSANWKTIYWKQDPLEASTADSTILLVKGYDINGSYQTYWDTTFTANDSIENFNNIIDASLYPYISLQAYYNDTVTNTPAQIDRWHVLYDPVPEAAIDGTTLFTWSQPTDTLEAGQTVDFAVDVKNIFTVHMDSLLINYWLEDAAQNKYPIPYSRQDSLKVGETLRDTITFSTEGLNGVSSFWMEVNPYVNGSLYITDQPEQAHFNNVLTIPFWVNPDEINPILDVTFDGRHILNGDIVSPNSEVLITLKDENEFLIMDDDSDTSAFGVYLTDPTGNQVKIPFVNASGDMIMQWVPANAQNKRFKIIWPAEFTMDGVYTLFVQGTDKSGNISGDIEYKVKFEIIHESSITNMMNYPNPFSTSTRFVFTLTGSEEPDDILIQILTVTGRVVREITENELGRIYIGRNITEYAWDGTDEFGDPLANGVYLYRVIAKINGEDIKHRETAADQYFKKDFGKMYLLR